MHGWKGRGRPALPGRAGREWSYAETQERVNRIANVLVRDLGLEPGNRLLLRAPNNPMMVAVYLAALKAGAVVVATMPMLRPRELTYMIDKARISHAVCDARLAEDLEKARGASESLKHIVYFATPAGRSRGADGRRVERFRAVETAAEDVCLVGFTSGTTGRPKGTMHFHRDLLATCDSYGRHVLQPRGDDLFIGSPPIAFTFGLGGLVLFPMRVGAASVLIEQAPPPKLIAAIERSARRVLHRAHRLSRHGGQARRATTCRACGFACRPASRCPRPTWDAWYERTGIKILDGIGSTEMLHIFIGAPVDKVRPVPPACRCPATRRASSTRRAGRLRPAPWAGLRCAGPPAAAISPTSARAPMSSTAGTSPATPM
jgi:2-aminobenzoate-CoA ligase